MAELARWQGGHVTTAQLHGLGLSRSMIERRAASGRLIRVHHGVYAVGHLPSTPLDRAHGALLATGPRSALAGRTALALWRAARTWPEQSELITPQDRRPHGLTVHHCSTLLRRDIRTVQGLRVTSPARTALDLAPHLGERKLTRIINELRLDNGLRVHQLRDVIGRNPRHPGAPVVTALIGDAQPEPTRSDLEDAFRRLVKRHRLPTPLINVHVGGERVDAYFPDHELVVELDGGVAHAYDWRPAFEEDRARMLRVMVNAGVPTIRLTWDQMTRLRRQTGANLRAILEARQRGARSP